MSGESLLSGPASKSAGAILTPYSSSLDVNGEIEGG